MDSIRRSTGMAFFSPWRSDPAGGRAPRSGRRRITLLLLVSRDVLGRDEVDTGIDDRRHALLCQEVVEDVDGLGTHGDRPLPDQCRRILLLQELQLRIL